ncbi:hypothetical protein [Variovorax sp. J31P207]|jgi:hypothetical protein|uniref:hypothetical protein n=1 Tax=Variovorax sp. J31P207 TaxID=3053510 RepID=UPI002574970D|nr:hypothetical protein [Variovorax sp. J31P207]MDM0066769.1 hypothetical protein [Variovorax sp. J31P207]
MFSNIVNAIIWMLIVGVAWYLVSFIPIPAPVGTIITILFLALAVVVLLSSFGVINVGVPRLYNK